MKRDITKGVFDTLFIVTLTASQFAVLSQEPSTWTFFLLFVALIPAAKTTERWSEWIAEYIRRP